MSWVGQYVGLPFRKRGLDRSGVDCYGLLRLVMGEQHGIWLPTYGEVPVGPRTELRAILRATRREGWRNVERGSVQAFDGVLMSAYGTDAPLHVGVAISPTEILHIEDAHDSIIARLSDSRVRARLISFHRHEALA